ncbi:hypothetical protein [Candidatus Korobacter versatilis]|uniref:hypothetical protein n=1 Tax=Candidatus Korobacter versatilis TaxID=658062 RepID=UPI00032641F6|nr:hypothetical protein [Candidatus Koribacter versatilis]
MIAASLHAVPLWRVVLVLVFELFSLVALALGIALDFKVCAPPKELLSFDRNEEGEV